MNLLLIAVLCFAAYLWWRIETARRAEAADERERDSYRRRIVEDPANIGAYEALGDSLHRAGRFTEARDAYLGALDAGSEDLVHDRTQYKLRQLDDDIRTRARGGRRSPTPHEMEFCPQCGAGNGIQRRRCEVCHALLPFASFWDALRNREVQRACLESICGIVLVTILVRLLYFMPIEIQAVTIVATAIVVSWRLLKSIDGDRG